MNFPQQYIYLFASLIFMISSSFEFRQSTCALSLSLSRSLHGRSLGHFRIRFVRFKFKRIFVSKVRKKILAAVFQCKEGHKKIYFDSIASLNGSVFKYMLLIFTAIKKLIKTISKSTHTHTNPLTWCNDRIFATTNCVIKSFHLQNAD